MLIQQLGGVWLIVLVLRDYLLILQQMNVYHSVLLDHMEVLRHGHVFLHVKVSDIMEQSYTSWKLRSSVLNSAHNPILLKFQN